MDHALFRIIIVEDDAAHAEAIKRALQDTGMNAHVDVAGSIEEFIRLQCLHMPDIALVDLNLPDGSAIDVLTSPPEEGLFPILVMTGHGDEQTAVEAMKAGAIDYIVKSPETFAEMPRVLVRTLREWRLLVERKNAAAALLESENKYRKLVENVGKDYFFYLHGVDGICFYVSPSVTGILGYDVSECMAHYAEYLTDNPVNKDVITYTELAMQGLQQQSYELEIYHKDRSRRVLEISEVPVRDEQGKVFAVEGIAKDITARKRVEARLIESEQSYRTLADSGQALIWASGTDKLCNYFNQAWLTFTGRPLQKELGNGWAEGVHPDDFEHCLEVYTASFDRRERFSMDYRLRRHDGEYRWLQDDGCPRYDSRGAFIGYIGYCLDINDRKLADQIVAAQRTELAAIYENAPFIMLLMDGECRVRKVNKLGAAFTKLRSAEMIGERYGAAVCCSHAQDDPQGCGFGPYCKQCVLRQTVKDTFETGKTHDQMEATMCFMVHGKKREVALLLSTSRLMLGEQVLILVTIMDITERKQLEQETRNAQTKLIQANKMSSLGMLVSSVAHEVNNPNNFIMFNSSLLSNAWKDMVRVLDDHAAEDPGFSIACLPYAEMRDAVPKLLSGITDGSRRIKDMVDHLRELSREDRSGLAGNVVVNAAARSALMILKNEIMKHTDIFSAELAEQLPLVTGSSQQIEQVVINLVHNALQALRDRKQAVSVRTFVDEAQQAVVIEVKDNGGGIAPKDLQRITEPFFTTKIDSGGTGLGLSISSSIIRDHGGRIEFESKEGAGTVVRVVLPYGKKQV